MPHLPLPRVRPLTRRATAVALLLAFATSGSGLPMCVASVAQLAATCEMHESAARHLPMDGHDHHFSGSAESRLEPGTCHEPGGASCFESGSCPAAGTAVASAITNALGSSAPFLSRHLTPDTRHLSFVAPPLPPPPQA